MRKIKGRSINFFLPLLSCKKKCFYVKRQNVAHKQSNFLYVLHIWWVYAVCVLHQIKAALCPLYRLNAYAIDKIVLLNHLLCLDIITRHGRLSNLFYYPGLEPFDKIPGRTVPASYGSRALKRCELPRLISLPRHALLCSTNRSKVRSIHYPGSNLS